MKIDLLGIKIDALIKDRVIEQISDLLNQSRSIFIVTPYSESIVATQRDEAFRRVLNEADLALPDGAGILWAAHYLSLFPSPGMGRDQRRGRTIAVKIFRLITSLCSIIFYPQKIRDPIPEKISGSEFIWDLAALAEKNNYSVFLLGGFEDTPELVAEKLKTKFPNLKIAGTSNCSPPIYRPINGQATGTDEIDQINSSGADFLFVALGPVRQEKWIYQNRDKLRVKLAIGLGGTFDYLAGKKPLAPQFWRQVGLEWLWRLLTQPKRVIRITRGVFGLIYYVLKA